MSKTLKALELFAKEYSCSQAVFVPFITDKDMSQDIALKISQGFGGGIGGKGNICGAVTGAYMAIGLKYGRGVHETSEAKSITYLKIAEFNKLFTDDFSSLECRTLLGNDMGTESGLKIIKESGITKTLCPTFVKRAVEIVEEICGE